MRALIRGLGGAGTEVGKAEPGALTVDVAWTLSPPSTWALWSRKGRNLIVASDPNWAITDIPVLFSNGSGSEVKGDVCSL